MRRNREEKIKIKKKTNSVVYYFDGEKISE